jgi:thiamine-phosphate pyrophosphorylase
MADNLAAKLRLMLVTDDALLAGRDPVALAHRAVAGGVAAVQLRLKEASPRELLALARRLVAELAVPVLVNDRPDVAKAAGAGVHLGPEDLPVPLARQLLPAGTIIGTSVGTEAELVRAMAEKGADYWGIGPWRVTGTKRDAGAAIGPEGFARIAARSGGRPCLAIGGVRPEDVQEVFRAGGTGVAVVSGILGADDVEAAARAYADAIREALPPGR